MIRSSLARHPSVPQPPHAVDWLDACCWGCGTDDVATHPDGRLLCRTCRSRLLAEPDSDVLQFSQRSYWESHALACCWRCMAGAVDPDDDVGLCQVCREHLT